MEELIFPIFILAMFCCVFIWAIISIGNPNNDDDI